MSDSLIQSKARLISFPGVHDASGDLHFWENLELFPDGIRRCFWVTGVQEEVSRGNHAHWQESQVLVAISGEITLEVKRPGQAVEVFRLNSPRIGLFVPPMHWVVSRFSSGAVLLGLSDREFSESDYIRDFEYFGSLQKRTDGF